MSALLNTAAASRRDIKNKTGQEQSSVAVNIRHYDSASSLSTTGTSVFPRGDDDLDKVTEHIMQCNRNHCPLL